ncbi:MAG: hypothetical protein H0W88_04105 [Parachlamydiaceae bacterium]|nr:hypothetical protein [Parachlamydiaceae bacterium]
MSIFINGLGVANIDTHEYVPGGVRNAYVNAVFNLNQLLTKTPIAASDYDAAVANLQAFANLGKYGVQDPPSSGITYYMNATMAEYISLIVNSLKSANITLPGSGPPPIIPPQDKISRVQQWQSLATFGIADILSQAYLYITSPTTVANVHSLQAMIELDYVKQGNDIISQQLVNLQKALSTTQSILDTLHVIQGISNQISVNSNPTPFVFPPVFDNQIPMNLILAINALDTSHALSTQWNTTFSNCFTNLVPPQTVPAVHDPKNFTPEALAFFNDGLSNYATAVKTFASGSVSQFESVYKMMASAHFTQIFPSATPTAGALDQLNAANASLIAEIANLATQGILPTTTNSLADFLSKVSFDITSHLNASGVTPQSGLIQWILDNQDKKLGTTGSNLSGAIQTNITQSITAAQSLNDTQKLQVQKYLQLFDNFYKSASDVLQKVTQMTESMAQKIAR